MSRVGKVFGLLTIVEEFEGKRGAEKVKCRCICGNEIIVLYRKLLAHTLNSCGCMSYEDAKKLATKNKWEQHRISIIGERFGNLVVVEELEEKGGKRMLRCLCDCGEETIVEFGNLRNHLTTSCGCRRWLNMSKSKNINDYKEFKKQNANASERLYVIWRCMRARCLNEENISYPHYGGRGITICTEWLDFLPFRTWAINNGYNDKLTLERVDVNGNYCPENCTWIPWEEQCNNKRNTIRLTYKGETHTLKEWSKLLGIPLKTLRDRACKRKNGWSDERILTQPIRKP